MTGENPGTTRRRRHIQRTALDAIPEFEKVYDEPTILRNEANVSVVSCQSSVVPCEAESAIDA